MSIELEVFGLNEILSNIQGIRTRLARARRAALTRFARYYRATLMELFSRLKKGGTYRGVTWEPYQKLYTRKDGDVPAHGGVAKVKGVGLVKGRRRPSGRRTTKGSRIMDDTGLLKSEAGATFEIDSNVSFVTISTEGVPYLGAQEAMRPFMFFESSMDFQEFRNIAAEKMYQEFKGE
jgi:hypothetical protein